MLSMQMFYFTMINFGNKDTYLDLDAKNDSVSIVIYSVKI